MSASNNRVAFGCFLLTGIVGFLVLFAMIIVGIVVVLVSDGLNISFGSGVAVLRINTSIMDSEPVLRQLKKLVEDPDTKALVVRVDSPGGSIGAAEEIYRGIKETSEEIPVIASMGSIAASGGYLVCLPAQRIFANSSTVTGSIGVTMEFISAETLLDKLGVKMETISSGELKDLGGWSRSLTDTERTYLRQLVNAFLEFFVERVAEDRQLAPEKVRSLADGRIMTGRQALEEGLVDAIGNLDDAVEYAAEIAGLGDDYETIEVRRDDFGWNRLYRDLDFLTLVKRLRLSGGLFPMR